jgi:hypothetical protein
MTPNFQSLERNPQSETNISLTIQPKDLLIHHSFQLKPVSLQQCHVAPIATFSSLSVWIVTHVSAPSV